MLEFDGYITNRKIALCVDQSKIMFDCVSYPTNVYFSKRASSYMSTKLSTPTKAYFGKVLNEWVVHGRVSEQENCSATFLEDMIAFLGVREPVRLYRALGRNLNFTVTAQPSSFRVMSHVTCP